MDLDLQQQIIDSTQSVFDTMLMMPLTPGSILAEKVYTFQKSISAMLGFAGEIQGMLTIHCPQEVAFTITSALLGVDVDTINEDVKDTIGELANMILGGIKDGFTEQGIQINLAIPTVLAGRSYRISGMTDALWITVPFYLDEGEFLVELKLKTPK